MNELERCRPWIEAALEYSNGHHEFEDIVDGIVKGNLQLWPGPDGCMVTELIQYPRKKMLNIFLAGGTLEQMHDMANDMRAWAKAQGCDGAMLSGRRGWVREMRKHGWKELWTTVVLEF